MLRVFDSNSQIFWGALFVLRSPEAMLRCMILLSVSCSATVPLLSSFKDGRKETWLEHCCIFAVFSFIIQKFIEHPKSGEQWVLQCSFSAPLRRYACLWRLHLLYFTYYNQAVAMWWRHFTTGVEELVAFWWVAHSQKLLISWSCASQQGWHELILLTWQLSIFMCKEFLTDYASSFLLEGKEMWKLIMIFPFLYTEAVTLCG